MKNTKKSVTQHKNTIININIKDENIPLIPNEKKNKGFLNYISRNNKVLKMTLLCLIILTLIPTFLFLGLGKSLSYYNDLLINGSSDKFTALNIIVILSWILLGIFVISYMLIGIRQLFDLRKKNPKYDMKSLESCSAWSAIFGFWFITLITSTVFDSILINRYKKTIEYKQFKRSKEPLLGVYDLCIMGLMIALTTVCQWLGARVIPSMPQGGSFFEMQCIIAVITCIVLRWQHALIVLLVSPLLWWITGGAKFYGPVSLLFDYHIAFLVFGLFCLINPIDKLSKKLTSNKIAQLAITASFGEILLFICFTMKFFSHVIAGYYQFLTPWNANVIYNAPYNAVSFGFTSALFLVGLKGFLMLRDYGHTLNNKKIHY